MSGAGARTALVLIDLRQWIVAMPWAPVSGADVVEAATRLREHFAEVGDPVVLVRYLRADGGDGGPEAPGNVLVPAMRPRAGERLVAKTGWTPSRAPASTRTCAASPSGSS